MQKIFDPSSIHSKMILRGKPIQEAEFPELKKRCDNLARLKSRPIKLCIIVVGDNPATTSYLNAKKVACEKVGIEFVLIRFQLDTTQEIIIETVRSLNNQCDVDGILIQLPLPPSLNSNLIMEQNHKDVDGLNNVKGILPCTPQGIMKLLTYYGISVDGKDVVIVGRSNIVGKPLALLMLEADATVTICHSKTINLIEHTRRADIVISAIGKANFFGETDFKKGSCIIDVGTNRDENGKLCGDVRFNEMLGHCISPVPGGVGPMTVLSLIENVIKLAELDAPS